MDRARRIKALTTLQRIKEHELNEQAAKMNIIRAAQGKLQVELDVLNHRVETESEITTPEAAPYLGGFLHAVEQRRGFLNIEMQKLEEEAALIEGRLFETFAEVRTNESVLDKTRDEKRRDEDLAERTALEEVARNRYLRQMGPQT